jgi:hypothetical protein
MTEAQQDNVFQRIYSVFGSQAAYERFEDALPFLHWAHRNKITCGLLSNADDRYRKEIIEQAVLVAWRPVLTSATSALIFRGQYFAHARADT